jgi:FkbM family methyltransferase
MTRVHISKNGKEFFVTPFRPHFWQRVARNTWEPHTFKIFDRYLSHQYAYIDIGAWIGPTVLYGATISKQVYAVEPDPVALRELKANLLMNPELNNIMLFEGCIGIADGETFLGARTKFGDSMASLLLAGNKNRVSVPSLSFSSFLDRFGNPEFNFVKMDIEGAESFILPTMKDILIERRPTLHLSVHSCWFENIINGSAAIVDVLSIYKYIYNHHGGLITIGSLLKNILHKGKLSDITATNEPI